VIRRGPSLAILRELIRESGAVGVFWNRRYEPEALAEEAEVEAALRSDGIAVETFDASLLCEPGYVLNSQGKPFRVFTPFWKACRSMAKPKEPPPAPAALAPPARWPLTLEVEKLRLVPEAKATCALGEAWRPGAEGARALLERFLEERLESYGKERDRPDICSTSRLSPHLHFGEISPTEVWHAVRELSIIAPGSELSGRTEAFLRQLGWREFAYHLLFHFPRTPLYPMRPEFDAFPWRDDKKGLELWQNGMTGYPLVDAGMRELRSTGWMHNRARMVAASFLVKDLLVPWQEGAKWFWETLVDADLANNTLGWQWVAGCGADAAPFFRVFNPVKQGEKFDPCGNYVRRWIPELAGMPDAWIHKPWDSSSQVLAEAGVKLGRSYPKPIVDHGTARNRALTALAKIRRGKGRTHHGKVRHPKGRGPSKRR
jgi:deoxyribodipyrimidine photo-lyase